MKKSSGFSLLELIIVVAIIGITTAIAIPSIGEYIKNDRLTTQINTLVSHIAYARSEAVTRSQQTAVCASTDLANCNGANWANGWIVVADTDGNAGITNGDTVLLVQQALEGGNTLTSSIGARVIYDNRGFPTTNVGTFSLCDDRGTSELRTISISATGRVRKGGATAC